MPQALANPPSDSANRNGTSAHNRGFVTSGGKAYNLVGANMNAKRSPLFAFASAGKADDIASERTRWCDAFEPELIEKVFHRRRAKLPHDTLRAKFGCVVTGIAKRSFEAKRFKMGTDHLTAVRSPPYKYCI
ncbi:hypothetical protein [Sphingomonas sp. Ant20]|uniref:hypothetical protein n=1 Tax=Sphingomonas sp. Ant20 TaxID=104605 RepID=UPI000A99D3B6|nr:hypothetical protein [Sphingomonas sp. Ant20]